jgi:hypothetical protein
MDGVAAGDGRMTEAEARAEAARRNRRLGDSGTFWVEARTGDGSWTVELHEAFPEPTLARLRELKAAYDPDEVFDQNFPIAPAVHTAVGT